MSAASAGRAASIIPDPSVRILRPEVPEEWRRNAAELAAWTGARLANRRDVFGHYLPLERRTPKNTAITDKSGLTLEVLERHYRGESVGDIIGLHSTAIDQGEGETRAYWSLWGALDVDRHKESDDPEANRRFVSGQYGRLVRLGFRPLLTDSDGQGGYHLRVLFNAPVPTTDVHRFVEWLREGWEFDGLSEKPEIFPKQASLAKGKDFGNWLRLPGHHHTREHWTRAWNGAEWLDGAGAIGFMLSLPGDNPGLIPHEALHPESRKFRMHSTGRLRAKAPERRSEEDLAREALGHLGHLVDDYDGWLQIGMSLHQLGAAGFRLWESWSQGGSKYQPGVCEAKWATFTSGGPGDLTIGFLFKQAADAGWTGFGARNGQENGHYSNNGEANGRRNDPGNGKADPTTPEPPTVEPADDFTNFSDEDMGILPLSSVRCRPIRWVWKYRLAVGALAMTAGDGGIGKSMLLLWIVATITRGDKWADGEGSATVGDVIIVSAEDRPDDTIKPRLLAMGADISRVTIIKAKYTIRRPGKPPLVHLATFQDRGYWKEIFRRFPNVRLFMVDPLPSYLGRGVNDSKNVEIRNVLEPFLEEVIAPLEVCMIGNTHLNKSVDAKTPMHRISGSIAYGNLPRNVHFVVRDPGNPERRFFKQAKCNNAPDDLTALAFKVEKREVMNDEGELIETAVPVFEAEPVSFDLGEAVNGTKKTKPGPEPKQTTAVAEWLYDFLAAEAGPVPVAAVFEAAGPLGFAGVRNARGYWSGVGTIYDAKKLIPHLPTPRAGKWVDEFEAEIKPRGRKIKHWHLTSRPNDDQPY